MFFFLHSKCLCCTALLWRPPPAGRGRQRGSELPSPCFPSSPTVDSPYSSPSDPSKMEIGACVSLTGDLNLYISM